MKTRSIHGLLWIIGAFFGIVTAYQANASNAVFIGSAGDHNLTTGSNWVGGSAASDWDRLIFGSAVVDGNLSINNFNGRSGITLASGITQNITINGPQPLIMGAVTSDGFIDMSSAARDLTINSQYWVWSNTNWNIGAGRTLVVNSGLIENNGPGITFTKDGSGTAWITSESTYTGGTTINAGTLVGLRGALGTGAVVINNGGVLYVNDQWVLCGVNGFGVAYSNPSSVTVNAGGQIALDAGNGYANGATNLYLNGGSVTGGNNGQPYGGLFLYNGNEQITAGGATISTISTSLALTGNNNTITVGAGSSLNITNVLKDNGVWGAGGFIKAGSGTLTLATPATYTGTTVVNAGTLKVTFDGGGNAGVGTLGVGSNITVNSGGTLLADTFNALGYASHGGDILQVNEGGILKVGAGQVVSMVYNLNVVGGSLTSADAGHALGTFYFNGAGTQTFTSSAGGTASVISAQNVNLAANVAFFVNDGPGAIDLNITGNLIGTSSLQKSGLGTMVLSGANTYAGTTILNGGNTRFASVGSPAVQSPVALTNGGFLVMDQPNQFGSNSTLTFSSGGGFGEFALYGHDQTIAGLSSTNGFAIVENSHSALGSAAANSILTINQNFDSTFSGFIRDNNGSDAFKLSLVKNGSGTLMLSGGAYNYTGTTTINAGILKFDSVAAVGSTSGITVNNTGSVYFDSGTAGGIISTPISLSGDGGGNTALNTNTPGDQTTFIGPITMTGSTLIRAIGDNSTIRFNNAIHGTGDFSFAGFGGGAGTKDFLVLSGASDFAGNLAIVNWFGAVQVTLSGGDNRLPTTALVTVRGSTGGLPGALDLNGNNQTLAGLTDTLGFGGLDAGARCIVNTSDTAATLTLNTTANQSSGVSIGGTDINGTPGNNLALVKSGAGTQTLTGISTFTGATTVSSGTLAGTGSLTSNVTVSSGGTLAPGIPGGINGTFTVNGADFSGGGKLAIRASSPTAFDKLVINGNLKVQGGFLEIDLSGFNGSGEFAIAQSAAWNTGAGFTVSFLNTPGNVTFKSVSYKTATHEVLLAVNTAGVTPVKIADFVAESEGAGVNVSWTCVSEFQNAGFNIYRRALESADWVKVNPTLIAGRITNPDEKKYSFFEWASAGMYEYKLESMDVSGGRESYSKLSDVVCVDWNSFYSQSGDEISAGVFESAERRTDMEVSAQTAHRVEAMFAAARAADISASPVVGQKSNAVAKVAVRELDKQFNVDVAVANNVVERNVATISLPALGARWFSSGRVGASPNYSAAKVTYKNAGVMLIPQSSMPDGIDLGSVALQREGRNMNALAKVPGGLLVYAPGYKDNYTDTDAIFLRKTTGPTNAGTPTIASGLFSSATPVNVTSSNSVTNNYHDVYFDYSLHPYTFEPWFSSKYLTQGSSQDFNVNLTDVVSGSATMIVNLWSMTSSSAVNPDHSLQVLVNGLAIGEASWNGGNKMLQLSFAIPASALKTGDNVVSLVTPTIAGQDSQIALLHSIRVNYTRGLDGSKPIEITNSSSNAAMYELNNVPAAGAWVVDARFSDRASLVPTETQVQLDGTLRLRFVAQSGGNGKFIVMPSGQENKPLQVSARQVKALKLNGTYLATGPAQFAAGVQPLLMKRAKEGIRGMYVDQEQLFDYYNYGRFGPDGIRNAVRSTQPAYLLLVGRTTYDYLNFEGQNIDPLCPAYLVSTNFWAQTTSDSAFGDLGRGYPEVAVGRLPVNNTTELSNAVSHIVSYKGISQSGIRMHAVADKPDPLVADFGAQLDATIKSKNPDMTWQENYLARTYQTAPEVTAALKAAANGGADLILYSGHGNAARLGTTDPRILDQSSVQSWTGNIVFLQSTCTANWMAKNVADYKSIAIQALTQSQGGISASIATSTYMNADVATEFMNQLIKNTNQGNARWGNVLLSTQQWAGRQTTNAFYKDLMTTEQLFGDPAMPVFTPKSINTAPGSKGGAGTPIGTF